MSGQYVSRFRCCELLYLRGAATGLDFLTAPCAIFSFSNSKLVRGGVEICGVHFAPEALENVQSRLLKVSDLARS